MSNNSLNKSVGISIEVSIRLILLFILVAWCLFLLLPFLEPVLWGIIIAVSISPMYNSLNKRLGDRPKLTSTLIVLFFLAVLIVPSYFVFSSMAETLVEVSESLDKQSLEIPPPEESIKDWPLVGEKIYNFWNGFSQNLEKQLNKYDGQIASFGKKLLSAIMGLTGTVAMFLISIIIAGVLLATRGTQNLMEKFYVRLVGEKGAEFANLSETTIRNVTKGVIGVAFIQAFILGLIFFFAGVPYAGVWAVLALILGIIQLPPSLVSIPVMIYIFSVTDTGMAIFWAVLILLAGFSDNILKPILMGKGASVPMLVIFLGSLGGFMATGFLGLFTGAIVLSLGYELFMVWLNGDEAEDKIQES